MKLQSHSRPGLVDKHQNRTVSLLHGLVYLSLCAAIAFVSNLASLSAANQTPPIVGRPELVLQTGHAKSVNAIAFSPNGRLLASGSADNTVKLWDTASKSEVRTLAGHKGWVKAIAFRPDGQWLASGAIDGNIKFSDVASGRELLNLGGNGSVSAVAFSPDGRWFASGNMEKVIKLWDLTTKGEPFILAGHTGFITVAAFSADGNWLATGSSDKTVKIWAVATGREVITLGTHTDRTTSLAFSADRQWLATGSFDSRIKLWKVGVWREQDLQLVAADRVLAVAFDPDGRTLVSADRHQQIKRYDLQTGSARTVDNAGNDGAREAIAIAFSSDVRWLASSIGDKRIELSDVATGTDVHSLTTHSYGVNAIAFSSGGRWFATGGGENTVKLWELATGRELRTLDPKNGFINSVSFSPDEQLLAAGSLGGNITLWKSANGQLVRTLRGHNGSVNAVAFSLDGKWIASAGEDRSVRLWNVADGSEVRPATNHAAEVNAITFSRDGKLIASGSADKTIKIWDATTGGELRTLSGHQGKVLAVSFSPDGRYIASGSSDRAVKIWEAESGQLVQTLRDHEADVKTVAFSKDGRLLASGSDDNRIDLWDVSTARLLTRSLGHTSGVDALAYSPDGRWLASGSEDGSTRIWNATTGEAAATLVSLRESAEGFSLQQTDWLVVAADGLFDGSPTAWKQILWRFDQSSFKVNPVEVFFNEFFYPGLLADVLAGKGPRAKAEISNKDRRQPHITMTLPQAQNPGSSLSARQVRIKLEVVDAPPDAEHPSGGGVRDLRLFRNGLLVSSWSGDILKSAQRQTIEASVVLVAGENRFTAYAFNRDNVKTTDATLLIKGDQSLRRTGTAYVIGIGVGRYANSQYNLNYSVADVTEIGEQMKIQQERLGRYQPIEVITLLNEDATKENILRVLNRLAGQETGPLPPGAPAALSKIKPAQPEDAVLLYFSGHGTARKDRFYLIPYDLGYEGPRAQLDQTGLEEILTHSISDIELEEALRSLDVDQLLLVIDACNSGQALEAEEKRRGPMNAKGLAQLAYEKGMYVLTASQSVEVAFESEALKHSYLAYVLVEEGIKSGQGDADRNGELLLREWFDYATERVPRIRIEKGRLGKELVEEDPNEPRVQRPRAFNMRDGGAERFVIARLAGAGLKN